MLFLATMLITTDSAYREASIRMPGQNLPHLTPLYILQTSFIFNGIALNLSKISLLVARSQTIKQNHVFTCLIAWCVCLYCNRNETLDVRTGGSIQILMQPTRALARYRSALQIPSTEHPSARQSVGAQPCTHWTDQTGIALFPINKTLKKDCDL